MRYVTLQEFLAAEETLDWAYDFLDCTSFHECLGKFLKDARRERNELYSYLLEEGLYLEKPAMHRYFQGIRRPQEVFVAKFGEFVDLSPRQRDNLLFVLRYEHLINRLREKVNSSGKSEIISVSAGDYKLLASALNDRHLVEPSNMPIQIPDFSIGKLNRNDLHSLLYSTLERTIELGNGPIYDWLNESRRVIYILLECETEEPFIAIAKCLFFWHLLYILGASFSSEENYESLKKNKYNYKRLLFYFLDIFPGKFNSRENTVITSFFRERVFRFSQNKPLNDLFDKWSGGIKAVVDVVEKTYDIPTLIAFTRAGRELTETVVQSIITSIQNSDAQLGSMLSQTTRGGFSFTSVELLQDSLRKVLDDYVQRYS